MVKWPLTMYQFCCNTLYQEIMTVLLKITDILEQLITCDKRFITSK